MKWKNSIGKEGVEVTVTVALLVKPNVARAFCAAKNRRCDHFVDHDKNVACGVEGRAALLPVDARVGFAGRVAAKNCMLAVVSGHRGIMEETDINYF